MYGPPEKLERQVFDGRFRVRASRLGDIGPVLDGGFGVETGIGQDSVKGRLGNNVSLASRIEAE